jgi:hypothetical protein
MKLNKALETFFGQDVLPADEVIAEKTSALLTENAVLVTENKGLIEEKSDLQTKVDDLEKLKPLAEVGQIYLKDMREKAEAQYKLLKGDSASEKMLDLIRKADIDQAKAYVEEFSSEVEEKLPGVCSVCGSQAKLVRRSSKEVGEEKTKDASRTGSQTNLV